MEIEMIIGITGRAGSGKDTVSDLLVKHHGFVKVAMADPLKRICRDVFRFTDEQLWGPSSARNAGDRRYLRSEGYAEAVKRNEEAAALAAQKGDEEVALAHQKDADAYARSAYLTPRHALQQLGTEWGRRCYQDVWVDYALRVADKLLIDVTCGGHPYDKYRQHSYHPRVGLFDRGTGTEPSHGLRILGVVISDVRFPNEVAAIRAKGGRIWKTTHGEGLGADEGGQHESESYISRIVPDSIIPNNVGLEELPKIVESLLKEAPYGLADNRRLQDAGILTRSPK